MLPPLHRGPQFSSLGKESKLPCQRCGAVQTAEVLGETDWAPMPAVPVLTCVNWVESLFSGPQFLGLGNGAELQYLPLRVAQTISLDKVHRVTSLGQAHSITQ